jgi:hypothetical protein
MIGTFPTTVCALNESPFWIHINIKNPKSGTSVPLFGFLGI